MQLIDPIRGDAIARAAWSLAYFGRTLYFNGPRGTAGAKGFLRDEPDIADPARLANMLRRGRDPIGALLDRTVRACYTGLGTRERAAKRARWEFAEPTLNARCRLALALLEPKGAADAIRRLIPRDLGDGTLRLSRVHPVLDDKGRIGTPDVLLAGRRTSVLIEMKVRGLPSRHMYDVKQFVQYLNLAAGDLEIGDREGAVHILLRPNAGGPICRRRKLWFSESPDGGPIELDRKGMREIARGTQWGQRLRSGRALRHISSVPVFERTYEQLVRAIPKDGALPRYSKAVQYQLQLLVERAEPRQQLQPHERTNASASLHPAL